VVEGVGDHGCEYMTGGRAVVLGPTGRNFAAGMSGGIAYVWDPFGDFPIKCNLGMVELEDVVAESDVSELWELIELHERFTGSAVAKRLLQRWPEVVTEFVKVMPTDYKRVLAARAEQDEELVAEVHDEIPQA
jgi:glutamate synthase (NADPH/NADH) large chain